MTSSQSAEPYDVLIGIVVGAHGVRGEVRVHPETDFPERFTRLEQVWLAPPHGEARLIRVLGARPHTGKGQVLLRLEGVQDREAVEALRGAGLYLRESELWPLPPGQYWEFQLVGLRVVTEEGRDLGPITAILRTGANDVYETPLALIPAVPTVVREVDLPGQRVVVGWVEGLLK